MFIWFKRRSSSRTRSDLLLGVVGDPLAGGVDRLQADVAKGSAVEDHPLDLPLFEQAQGDIELVPISSGVTGLALPKSHI